MPGWQRFEQDRTSAGFSFLIIFVFFLPLSLSHGQTPDVEICKDTVGLVEGSPTLFGAATALTDSIEVDEVMDVGDVHIEVNWSAFPDNPCKILTITSPEGTELRIIQADSGWPLDGGLVSGTRLDATFSDHGDEYNSTRRNCRCLIQPRGVYDDDGDLVGIASFADLVGEAANGTWTLEVTQDCSLSTSILNRWCLRVFENPPPLMVTDLTCELSDESSVDVEWTNTESYDSVEVRLNGELYAELDGPFDSGADESTTVDDIPLGQYAEITVAGVSVISGDGYPQSCRVAVIAAPLSEACDTPDAEFSATSDTAEAAVTFDDSFTVGDLQVQVDIAFAGWSSKLELVLTSPEGTEVFLRQGAGQDTVSDGLHCTFWEMGRRNTYPFSAGEYIQAYGPGALRDFFGEDSDGGDWNLTVSHTHSGPQAGTLETLCVRIYEDAPVTRVSGLTCGPSSGPEDFALTWTNTADYETVFVYVNDSLQDTLDGPFDAGDFEFTTVTLDRTPVFARICLRGQIGEILSPESCCEVRAVAFEGFSCESIDGTGVVDVSWDSNGTFDQFNIIIDGVTVDTLDGAEDSFSSAPLTIPSNVEVAVEAVRADTILAVVSCTIALLSEPTVEVCDTVDFEVDGSSLATTDVLVDDELSIGTVELPLTMSPALLMWGTIVGLSSPTGTTVVLHRQELLSGTGPDVIFSDDGDPYPPLGGEILECTCLIQPRGPGDFGDFAGEPGGGLWELTVDNDFYLGGAVTVERWCVRIHEGCTTAGPSSVTCVSAGTDVTVEWVNEDTYEAIEIVRDGRVVASLGGEDTEFVDDSVSPGHHVYEVVSSTDCASSSGPCAVDVGLHEVCSADLGLEIAVAPTEVVLDIVTPAFSSGDVELALVGTLGTIGRLRVEFETPDATTLLVFDESVFVTGAVDVTFADHARRYDDSLLGFGGRLQLPLPGTFADLEGASGDGSWTTRFSFSTVDTGDPTEIDAVCLRVFEQLCEAPTGVTCDLDGEDLDIAWTNEGTYDEIEVLANGATIAVLDGEETSFVMTRPLAAHYLVELIAHTSVCEATSEVCEIDIGLTEICEVSSEPIGADVTETLVMDVSGVGAIRHAEVSVNIAADPSTWALKVISPVGTEIILHAERGTGDDLVATFSDTGAANSRFHWRFLNYGRGDRLKPYGPGSFRDVQGESADGEWALEVMTTDSGVFFDWCVRIFEQCSVATPSALTCTSIDDTVELEWVNGETYDFIDVYRGTTLIASLTDAETSHDDVLPPLGTHQYRVVGYDSATDCGAESDPCEVTIDAVTQCRDDVLIFDDASGTNPLTHTETIAFDDTFTIDRVEIRLDIESFIGVPEIALESPAGTTVDLLGLVEFGWDGTAGMDVVLTPDGPRFDPSLLASGAALQSRALAALAGERSTGFEDWKLRFKYVETLNEWCLDLFPRDASELEPEFLRGDCDGNGTVLPILDALFLLEYGFTSGPPPPCFDAADVDDSGGIVAILDALLLLEWGFTGGPPPPSPGPMICGPDPTDDGIDCGETSCP